jgi:hypothetical protein
MIKASDFQKSLCRSMKAIGIPRREINKRSEGRKGAGVFYPCQLTKR